MQDQENQARQIEADLKTKFRYWADLQPIFNVFITVTTLLIYFVKNNFTIECTNVTSLKDLEKETGQVEDLESKIEVLITFLPIL